MADGGALTTDGTFIYAFQGKTTAFWRYNIAANTWTALAPFSAATNQGGALVFVPGLNPQGRFTSLSASRSLVVTGDAVKVTLRLESSTAVNNVVPGALTVTPTAGASCSTLTGPTLVSADDDIANIDDAVVYEWTCTVAAGATPGSLTFSDCRDRRRPGRVPGGDVEQRARLAAAHVHRDGARRRAEPDRRPGPAGGERPDRRARRPSRRSSARRS